MILSLELSFGFPPDPACHILNRYFGIRSLAAIWPVSKITHGAFHLTFQLFLQLFVEVYEIWIGSLICSPVISS